MNTCAVCRFWVEPRTAYVVPVSRPGVWKMCDRTREADGLIFFEAAGWDGDHGEIVTRADFGCVQFEPLPVPETMPVVYAGPGESVQPLPGHIFTAPNWPDTKTTAMKVSINGQWFEIRPRVG